MTMQNAPAVTGQGVETWILQTEDDAATDILSAPSLQDIFDWLPLPSGKTLRRLLDRGATFDSLYQVKLAWVRFDGDRFDFDSDMAEEPDIIFKCEDQGEVIDLAAWSARDNKLATWRGRGFCVGDLDQCFSPATWFAGGGLRLSKPARVDAGGLRWNRGA